MTKMTREAARASLRTALINQPCALALNTRGGQLAKEFIMDLTDGNILVTPEPQAGVMLIPTGSRGKSVAVVSVRGVATFDFEFQPFAFSARRLEDTIDQLADDDDVSKIVLHIDSPGGGVTGIPEAADAIFRARQSKEVVAFVDALAASAAYWLASQATRITMIPSGEAGSIGVFLLHEDLSQMAENLGIKHTFIFAGPHKVEANSLEPLTAEAQAQLQSDVNEIYGQFVSAVARGRGVSTTTVRNTFGGGRVMMARDAKKAGLVDRIETFGGTIGRLGIGGPAAEARSESNEIVADMATTIQEFLKGRGSDKNVAFREQTEQAMMSAGPDPDTNDEGKLAVDSSASAGEQDPDGILVYDEFAVALARLKLKRKI